LRPFRLNGRSFVVLRTFLGPRLLARTALGLPRFAAAALVFLAQAAAGGAIGLRLAGGRSVDARVHDRHRCTHGQGDQVHCGPGDAAGQSEGGGEEENKAHDQSRSGSRVEDS